MRVSTFALSLALALALPVCTPIESVAKSCSECDGMDCSGKTFHCKTHGGIKGAASKLDCERRKEQWKKKCEVEKQACGKTCEVLDAVP